MPIDRWRYAIREHRSPRTRSGACPRCEGRRLSKLRPEASAFALSRIYAQGWNTGKKLIASGREEVSEPDVTARNPYSTPEERSRWMKGITDAFASRAGTFTTPGGNSWPGNRSRAKAGAS